MDVIASGRDSDVYAYSDGQVLRRYRDGRSAVAEAATIRGVAALGYPVPAVYSAAGPDIVMERIQGPTLAEAALTGMSPSDAGATLAGLHDRLHALPWPAAGPDECLLHLDLHPLNVIVADRAPVVIDWSNAGAGPAGLDVALSAIMLGQVIVTDGLLESLGLAADGVSDLLAELLRSFARAVSTPYAEHLPAAEALRRQDRYQSAAELAGLPRAVDLARSVAPGRPAQ